MVQNKPINLPVILKTSEEASERFRPSIGEISSDNL